MMMLESPSLEKYADKLRFRSAAGETSRCEQARAIRVKSFAGNVVSTCLYRSILLARRQAVVAWIKVDDPFRLYHTFINFT